MRESRKPNHDLMLMHVESLYNHDDNSRMISVNDWKRRCAPLFFLGRTDNGNVVRFRNDLPGKVCNELSTLAQSEPSGFSERPRHESEYKNILLAHGPITNTWAGPAYWFATPAKAVRGTILINSENSHLLNGGLSDWLPDVPHQQPFAAVADGKRALAVCASVRITDAAHEAGVETLASHRRKGYAARVVSCWANAVEKKGALPLYSTSFDNIASQKVAARLGLSMYGVDFHIS